MDTISHMLVSVLPVFCLPLGRNFPSKVRPLCNLTRHLHDLRYLSLRWAHYTFHSFCALLVQKLQCFPWRCFGSLPPLLRLFDPWHRSPSRSPRRLALLPRQHEERGGRALRRSSCGVACPVGMTRPQGPAGSPTACLETCVRQTPPGGPGRPWLLGLRAFHGPDTFAPGSGFHRPRCPALVSGLGRLQVFHLGIRNRTTPADSPPSSPS